MRTEEEIITLILNIAEKDKNIRAVLLTGSRANPKVRKDKLQDFDIIYIVTQLDTFIQDPSWIDVFGERLIMQLPDEMIIGERDVHIFHYLMLFTDGNRIDLTLLPVNRLHYFLKEENLLKVLLDKDKHLVKLPSLNEKSYLIKQSNEKEFLDCCNEFWWVCTYVAKGLWRKEIVYAKEMLEKPVRTMFLQMIEWYIGIHTSFSVPFGKSGRNMQPYLSPQLYNQILNTYSDSNIKNTRESLFLMAGLFDKLAKEVANAMHFHYRQEESNNVISYLKHIYVIPQG
jgi:aminoglycoside 6-adenylyltransferase